MNLSFFLSSFEFQSAPTSFLKFFSSIQSEITADFCIWDIEIWDSTQGEILISDSDTDSIWSWNLDQISDRYVSRINTEPNRYLPLSLAQLQYEMKYMTSVYRPLNNVKLLMNAELNRNRVLYTLGLRTGDHFSFQQRKKSILIYNDETIKVLEEVASRWIIHTIQKKIVFFLYYISYMLHYLFLITITKGSSFLIRPLAFLFDVVLNFPITDLFEVFLDI